VCPILLMFTKSLLYGGLWGVDLAPAICTPAPPLPSQRATKGEGGIHSPLTRPGMVDAKITVRVFSLPRSILTSLSWHHRSPILNAHAGEQMAADKHVI
ncbi:hypothetical protein B0H14DRAFT_2895159, partial [Mycena olivaceomarginata]